jgi:hypothetical protein
MATPIAGGISQEGQRPHVPEHPDPRGNRRVGQRVGQVGEHRHEVHEGRSGRRGGEPLQLQPLRAARAAVAQHQAQGAGDHAQGQGGEQRGEEDRRDGTDRVDGERVAHVREPVVGERAG